MGGTEKRIKTESQIMKEAIDKTNQWGMPGDVSEGGGVFIFGRNDKAPITHEGYPEICKVSEAYHKHSRTRGYRGWCRESDQNRKPDY